MSRAANGQRSNAAEDATPCPPALIAAIESQGSEVRRLKASGFGNKDAPVLAAVAELKRLRAQLVSASRTEVKQDEVTEDEVTDKEVTGDRDFSAFMEVQKNRSVCIHWLLTFTQRIEQIWYVELSWSAEPAVGVFECQLAPSACPRLLCLPMHPLTGTWTARLAWLRSPRYAGAWPRSPITLTQTAANSPGLPRGCSTLWTSLRDTS